MASLLQVMEQFTQKWGHRFDSRDLERNFGVKGLIPAAGETIDNVNSRPCVTVKE